MARANFLNILEDIESLSDIELAIFATYSFDHVFFENVLMRELRRNNPGIIIIVLVDIDHYPNPADFSEATGIEYLLLPIMGFLFHPKIFLFLSKKKGVAYIGSHNLTLNGITHNLELTFKTEQPPLIFEVIDFLSAIMEKNFGDKSSLIDTLAKYKDGRKSEKKEKPDVYLIHNIKRPILQTTLNILAGYGTKFSEAVIFAPFFSNERHLLERINSSTNVKKIEVCIQRNNHNLNVNSLSKLPFVSTKEIIPKENRRMHSKFLIFRGQNTFVLMGSPNFTNPALNQIAGPGNVELAVLMQPREAENIFDELTFKNITPQEIQASVRNEVPMSSGATKYDVTILIAEIDRFGQIVISVQINSHEKDLTLIVDHPSGKIAIPILIREDEKRITIRPEISGPLSVWFEYKAQRVSNIMRVYNPSEMVFSFAKTDADVHAVPALIANTKNLEDIFRIIAALFPDERHVRTPSQSRQGEPSPGRFLVTEESQNIFDILLNLLRAPRNLRSNRRDESKNTTPKQVAKKESADQETDEDYEWAVSKLFEKWTDAFGIRRLSRDNSPANYSAFLLISLKMIEILISDEQKREYFTNYIMNSLSDMFETYGTSGKKEELLLLISIALYVECEIIKANNATRIYKISTAIIRDSINSLENLLFSDENALIGLKLMDQVNQSLSSIKFLHPIENTAYLKRVIASLTAVVILKKKRRLQLLVLKNLIHQIGETKEDDNAFYICLVLQSIIANGASSEEISTEIGAILNNKKLRHFRQNLYEDILNAENK
jgi:HKD family nuclease